VGARTLFLNRGRLSIRTPLKNLPDVHACREWLVRNIKGLGYKEASHFLRNIGFGDRIAILDRHILRNLVHFDVIQEIPTSMSRSGYMQIEQKMAEFAREIHIPLAHLDLLLWYKETGEIFK
jgi:N-glycosylase/DNA lyase